MVSLKTLKVGFYLMNFLKNLATTGLVAATAIGFVVVAQPQQAQAYSIGSKIDFVGRADAKSAGIDFQALFPTLPITDEWILALGGTGSFASITAGGTPVTPALSSFGLIKDLAPLPSGPKTNWLRFGFLTPFNTADDVLFDLTNLVVVSPTAYNFTGVFDDGTPGVGQLTSQIGFGTTSFSATVTAVPTPALIPGIAAMGLGLLRRKKAQAVAA
jgi:hypothetical protein